MGNIAIKHRRPITNMGEHHLSFDLLFGAKGIRCAHHPRILFKNRHGAGSIIDIFLADAGLRQWSGITYFSPGVDPG